MSVIVLRRAVKPVEVIKPSACGRKVPRRHACIPLALVLRKKKRKNKIKMLGKRRNSGNPRHKTVQYHKHRSVGFVRALHTNRKQLYCILLFSTCRQQWRPCIGMGWVGSRWLDGICNVTVIVSTINGGDGCTAAQLVITRTMGGWVNEYGGDDGCTDIYIEWLSRRALCHVWSLLWQ